MLREEEGKTPFQRGPEMKRADPFRPALALFSGKLRPNEANDIPMFLTYQIRPRTTPRSLSLGIRSVSAIWHSRLVSSWLIRLDLKTAGSVSLR